MTFLKSRTICFGFLLFSSMGLMAQQPAQEKQPAAPKKDATPAPPAQKVDQAAAYYHFSLAHMYEEMMAMYGRSEYASKAIEEYRLAIQNDPSSEYLNASLAELYAKTGRIRDAVTEAQDIIKRDPDNLEAHKLLGRIYLRSLGDLQPGTQSREILTLAIEQYEALARIDAKDPDNHLVLGRLYALDAQAKGGKDLSKAEKELKTAINLDPNSEEAVTYLAFIYNDAGETQKAAD